MGFLPLPASLSSAKSARYVVLPVPYDATTSYAGGTRLGPAAVLEASQHVELFDEELLFDPSTAGVFTADFVRPSVSGPKEAIVQVCKAAHPLVRSGKFLLGLGGEHSITSGLVNAVKEETAVAGPLGVLQLDAHSDLRDDYMGSPWSHGCVMRRIHQDLGLPISPVGIRSFCQAEHDYMRAKKIDPITPAMIAAGGSAWIRKALAKLPKRIYITIDIDVFDPGLVPGTGTPEPGGLSWGQVTALLRAACEQKDVVAADIVEVSPVPGSVATEYLAARLGYKLITYQEKLSAFSGQRSAKTKNR
ncbi:MAG: agmatinase [Phycisphaerae bacterium]|nr:agmatinase [Phycisphaerae bacterium]